MPASCCSVKFLRRDDHSRSTLTVRSFCRAFGSSASIFQSKTTEVKLLECFLPRWEEAGACSSPQTESHGLLTDTHHPHLPLVGCHLLPWSHLLSLRALPTFYQTYRTRSSPALQHIPCLLVHTHMDINLDIYHCSSKESTHLDKSYTQSPQLHYTPHKYSGTWSWYTSLL